MKLATTFLVFLMHMPYVYATRGELGNNSQRPLTTRNEGAIAGTNLRRLFDNCHNWADVMIPNSTTSNFEGYSKYMDECFGTDWLTEMLRFSADDNKFRKLFLSKGYVHPTKELSKILQLSSVGEIADYIRRQFPELTVSEAKTAAISLAGLISSDLPVIVDFNSTKFGSDLDPNRLEPNPVNKNCLTILSVVERKT